MAKPYGQKTHRWKRTGRSGVTWWAGGELSHRDLIWLAGVCQRRLSRAEGVKEDRDSEECCQARTALGWARRDSGCKWRGRRPTVPKGTRALATGSAGQSMATQQSGSPVVSWFSPGKRIPVILGKHLGRALSCLRNGMEKLYSPHCWAAPVNSGSLGMSYSQPLEG